MNSESLCECECGCGNPARSGNRFVHGHHMRGTTHTESRRRHMSNLFKGRTISGEQREKQRATMTGKLAGDNHPSWNGGRRIDKDGYVLIWVGGRRYEREHRLVMGANIGRPLTKNEVVHHIDGDRENNDLSNLVLFPSQSEHRLHHVEAVA